ncbi:hypothetical protein ACJ41O_010212 [Fusarium nematophilum]
MAGDDKAAREPSPREIISHYVLNKHLEPSGSIPLRPWQMLPELPEMGEIMAFDPAPLPLDARDAEAPAKDQYLEWQYRLSRFEGTELLRRAVNAFREEPTMMESEDFYIYTQVHVQGYLFASAGAACRISLSTERSPTKVNWAQSARLTSGTLVALSPRSDSFTEQCYLAVVAARYLLGGLEPNPDDGEGENTPPRIEIFWSNCKDAILDPSVELVMIEAKGGYFETVRHAMVGLQHAALFESKFDKYIIDGNTKDSMASYIKDAPGQSAHVPTSARLFDPSQTEAFQRMTSCEFAIVQGPPGTGKTFTSVVALESHVRTLQAARGKGEPMPPVIVAAQTNHALDQLLGRCEAFDAVICRLGGRTEDESIEERTLFNLRKNSKLPRGATKAAASRKAILNKIENTLSACFPCGLIPAEKFHHEGLITEEQLESLDDEEWESATLASAEKGDATLDNTMFQWLEGRIERDETYVYRPPSGQTEAPVSEDAEVDLTKRKDEDQKERLHGQYISTEFYLTGTVPGSMSGDAAWCYQARKLLARHSNLYEIKPPQRGMVYRYLRKRLIDMVAQQFPKLVKEYQAICLEHKIGRLDNDVKILRNERIEIVGCTTTGLSKYSGLIAALKPRVLMIEEAAETREANITSALYPSLDQIVLVGDHQQLVPHVDVRELGRDPYNLHVSLFERLVRLKVPYSMLRVQRRMIPDIRKVVNAFYPKLDDHITVKDPQVRPPVPGMGDKSLWWFHHTWAEAQNANDFSFSNPQEADMMVRFVRYLVQNSVRPSQITILTFYKGQVALLLQKLRRDQVLSSLNPTKEWSVRTVDGFQGEENEIILLSLVRSPCSGGRPRAGFVDNENRAVVATSRAKCGFYIFGNAHNLLQSSPKSHETWGKVYDIFVEKHRFDTVLPLTCKKHGNLTEIKDLHAWDTIPGGGCTKRCDEKCPQGHDCLTTCHPEDQARLRCKGACDKILKCGHGCAHHCGEPCQCPYYCSKPPTIELPLRGPMPRGATPNQSVGQANRGGKPGNGIQRGGMGGSGGKGGQTPRVGQAQNNFENGRKTTHGGPAQIRGSSNGNSALGFPSQTAEAQISMTKWQAKSAEQGDLQEPSSEDLMEMGYYSHVSQLGGGKNKEKKSRVGALKLSLPPIPSFESDPTSLTEDSISDKWSPEKVSQRDETLRMAAIERRKQTSPCSMLVQETYRQTSTAADATRIYGKPVLKEYTLPAPPPQRPTEIAGSEVSIGATEKTSRKHLLLDAAAGLYPDDGYCRVEATVEAWAAAQDARQVVEDQEVDLISFD